MQAILLLCSFFNKNESRNIKPLTPTEYSRLAVWLHQNQFTPADFLTKEEEILSKWHDPKNKITQERLSGLLQRAASMGFALEKWQQQNVWILSRASQEYPKVLKEKLGDTRSPLLYCIGNKELLATPGIGFVGSRDTNKDDESFTQALAQQAVEQGFTVVSGGAKGVDQTSMLAALEAGGSAIGILADSLLKSATKAQYRKALQEDRLLLITPYYPEASFNTGNAMGRNKYIYSLSTGVIVAKSAEKGGTWEGATENLKKQWVPLWVRDIDVAGNKKLIELGGQALSESKVDFNELQSADFFASSVSKQAKEDIQPALQMGDFFSEPEDTVVEVKTAPQKQVAAKVDLSMFLELFYQQLQQEKDEIHTPKTLAAKHPELTEAIIKQWLNALDEKGLVKRQGKKLAYTLTEQQSV
ncbi:MAG: DNA-processing protein DprA [Motiliproteus sp.]